MVVLGKTGAGKSSFGNTVLGTASFSNVFSSVSRTTFTEISTCRRFGKKLVVCDTPGLFDTRFSNNIIRRELSWSMVLSEPGLNVFLIVVRCDVRFSQEECDVVERIENHFGINVYKYAIVIFTHKDQLEFGGDTEEGLLKNMPTRFQELLRKVNNKYIFVNNRLPYHLNEQVVRKLLDYICEIYHLNEPNIYKNLHLLKSTLKERFEYDPDKDRNWRKDWKCPVM